MACPEHSRELTSSEPRISICFAKPPDSLATSETFGGAESGFIIANEAIDYLRFDARAAQHLNDVAVTETATLERHGLCIGKNAIIDVAPFGTPTDDGVNHRPLSFGVFGTAETAFTDLAQQVLRQPSFGRSKSPEIAKRQRLEASGVERAAAGIGSSGLQSATFVPQSNAIENGSCKLQLVATERRNCRIPLKLQ